MSFLMNSQRIALAAVLNSSQFSMDDFDLVSSTARAASHQNGDELRFRGTPYYFGVYPNDTYFNLEPKLWIEFSPGNEELHEYDQCYSFDNVLRSFKGYLSLLRREISVQDPWLQATKLSETLRALPDGRADNLPIDERERSAIQSSLERIENRLLEQVAADAKKEQFVRDQFRVLTDAVTKFGRKDYFQLLVNALTGIAVNLVLPLNARAEIGGVLLELARHLPKMLAGGS